MLLPRRAWEARELSVRLRELASCVPSRERWSRLVPHEPAIEFVEELSDVSPLVMVAPTTHDGVDLFYQLLGAPHGLRSRTSAAP